jgi:hypothetical protein
MIICAGTLMIRRGRFDGIGSWEDVIGHANSLRAVVIPEIQALKVEIEQSWIARIEQRSTESVSWRNIGL